MIFQGLFESYVYAIHKTIYILGQKNTLIYVYRHNLFGIKQKSSCITFTSQEKPINHQRGKALGISTF